VQAITYVNGVAQARSAAFDTAVRYGGRPVLEVAVQRVNVTTGAVTIVHPDVPVIGLPSVSVDETAASRRSLTITVGDDDGTLAPVVAADALSPYGNELRVRAGFLLDDGTTELLPMGVFRITTSNADGRGSITLTCRDRSEVVKEARWEVPYVISGTPAVHTAVAALVLSRFPGLTVMADPSLNTVPLTVYQEGSKSGDPWANAQQLAQADGMEVFFTADGDLRIRKVVDPTLIDPVWTYQPGEGELYMASDLELDASGAKNVAIVTGEGTQVSAPVRGVAEITDTSSPLHPNNLGRRPVFLSSPLVTTQGQADSAAEALLLRSAGGSEHLRITAAPHPAHEAGDVVVATNPELGLSTTTVLAKFAMPLYLSGPVEFDTRARRAA
jgi:hypothetical protein